MSHTKMVSSVLYVHSEKDRMMQCGKRDHRGRRDHEWQESCCYEPERECCGEEIARYVKTESDPIGRADVRSDGLCARGIRFHLRK